MDILKAGSQGGVQDFLPVTIDPRGAYQNDQSERCLNKVMRKLARGHPQPSIPAVTRPLADDVLVDFLGSKFPKITDDTFRSIQAAVLAVTIPLINMWADMLHSGSLDQEKPTLDAGDVLPAIQKALVLSGNAASYISRVRRDQILMHFDPNLSSILRKLL